MRLIPRILAALLALIGLSLIVMVTAVDRTLLAGDGRAASLFGFASSDAAALAASDALSKGNLRAAEALSLLAIRNSPLNARGITLLGLVREAGGLEQEAVASMSVAGSLGWRNEAAQLWIANKAAQQGALGLAVTRADALLRQGAHTGALIKSMREAAANAEGRQAIVERLGVNPPWRSRFLADLHDLEPSGYGSHEAILNGLKRTAHPASDVEISAYVSHLVGRRQYDRAITAWRRLHRHAAMRTLLGDPYLEELFEAKRSPSPFDWNIREVPGVEIGSGSDQIPFRGNAVRVQASGSTAGVVLEQLIALPAGRYIFQVHGREDAANSLESLDWVISCVEGKAEIQEQSRRGASARAGWSRLDMIFTVPPAGCPAQRIELRLGHQSARRLDAAFAAARLTPAQARR